jgi:GNAT superfamily N-acetyltransferase
MPQKSHTNTDVSSDYQINGEFIISTDRGLLPVEQIHRYLSEESYWAKGIPYETVQMAIINSLNFGVYRNGGLVGYARVITDYATIAYLGDVFILPEWRGLGLSKWLMEQINHHPSLQGLRRWILLTKDAHGLYEQFGWKNIADASRWMEKHNATVYQQNA